MGLTIPRDKKGRKVIGRYRYFGGKKYEIVRITRKKSVAQAKARSWRDKGYGARVVRVRALHSWGKWGVYVTTARQTKIGWKTGTGHTGVYKF